MAMGQASRACDPAYRWIRTCQEATGVWATNNSSVWNSKWPDKLHRAGAALLHITRDLNLTVPDLFTLSGWWIVEFHDKLCLATPASIVWYRATKHWRETMEGHCRGLEIIITMTAPIFIVARRLPTAGPKCFVINRKSCSPCRINSTSFYWVSHGSRFHCFLHCVVDTIEAMNVY